MYNNIILAAEIIRLILTIIGVYYAGGFLLVICYLATLVHLTIDIDGKETIYQLTSNKYLEYFLLFVFSAIAIWGFTSVVFPV